MTIMWTRSWEKGVEALGGVEDFRINGVCMTESCSGGGGGCREGTEFGKERHTH